MSLTRLTHSRRLVARVAALLFSVVIALTCARWSVASGDWLGAPPSSQPLPSLDGATAWINSPPLAAQALRGKVVLVDFWTYSCINCLRTLPYVRAWSQKYGPHGLVVIGVHAPEFDFEHSIANGGGRPAGWQCGDLFPRGAARLEPVDAGWHLESQRIELAHAGGRIALRFRARDLHLVLGPTRQGHPVRFKVRIDGKAPGVDRGSDIDADGTGRIDAQRLYQLVRLAADGRERLFEIEFLDAGARAYAFTFG